MDLTVPVCNGRGTEVYCVQRQAAESMEAMEVDEEWEGAFAAGPDREEQEVGDLPPHWLKMRADTPVVAVELSKESEEYNSTLALFLTSFSTPGVEVRRIFRIQSVFLWRHFLLKREEMLQEHGGKEVEEKRLFHGTKCRNVDGICRKGFDWRLSARTKYGEGCYFARNSNHSHIYSPKAEGHEDLPRIIRCAVPHGPSSAIPCASSSTHPSLPHPLSPSQRPLHHHNSSWSHIASATELIDLLMGKQKHCSGLSSQHQPSVLSTPFSPSPQNFPVTVPQSFPLPSAPPGQPPASPSGPGGLRYMFVGRVLVGRKVRGHTSYRRPPALQPGDPYGASFDTCVDCERDGRIFVVFDINQAYPEYLLEYSCDL